MRLIGVKILHEFKQKHADISPVLDSWVQETLEAQWLTPHEVKKRYSSADILSRRRMIINLKGNKYRLLIQIDYERGIVFVKAIGTHAEYSKWKLE